jgi:UDP-glucose 4-epimerase
MRTLIIVGGLGYLGGRIALACANNGWKVLLASRAKRTLPIELEHAGISLIAPGTESIALQAVSAIIMLAAANELTVDIELACRDTTLGCARWLQWAGSGKKKFIYVSTAHVYGTPQGLAFSEATLPRPRHSYADTHLAAEVLVQGAHRRGAVEALIFRLSNAFGAPAYPGVERWSLLLSDLAKQAASSGHMQLASDGRPERDFITLSDVCAAMLWALARDHASEEAAIFNLCSEHSVSVLSMAQRLASRFARVVDAPTISCAATNNTLATPFLLSSSLRAHGFTPSNDIDAELDRLVSFCRQHF